MQAATTPQVKWTVEDYHRMIKAGILDERKAELLVGEICTMAPEGAPHAQRSGSLADELYDQLKKRALVRKAAPITLPNYDSEPEPDVAIVQGSWADYAERQPNAEDILLLVEVSQSTLAKDTGLKRKLYAEAGISDYWVIDIKNSKLIVFRGSENGDYQSKTVLVEGNITPLAFPDITLSVSKVIKGR
ncbi:MAG: Uma2 family endonuclease [Cyanobacteria bacterium J06649_4]